jgi:nitrite reductase (NADH) small subunit
MDTRELDLGPIERVPRGEGRNFETPDGLVAVFRTRADEVYATQALCPHRQGPLADGFVGAGRVVCPLHAFHFDLATGAPKGNDCRGLATYAVRVDERGRLRLNLPGTRDAAA